MSIANVAQLTIDLYINSLKLERVGFLNDPSVMPVAGVFESAPENGVTVALEGKNTVGYHVLLTIFRVADLSPVYQTQNRQFTFVQQRTPIFKVKDDL